MSYGDWHPMSGGCLEEIQTGAALGGPELRSQGKTLDVVVPFTTPELTRRAVEFTQQLAHSIHVHMRLIRTQLVPFPAALEESPVTLEFLRAQMMQFHCELPYDIEIRFARAFSPALFGAITSSSVVVLATRKRPWVTHQERLARALQQAGYRVIVLPSHERSTRNA